jgi:hypothetical protein
MAWDIRPNPRNPAVREGEEGVVLSCGPQNAKGVQLKAGHCVPVLAALRMQLGNKYLAVLNEPEALPCVAAGHQSEHERKICNC